MKNAPKHPQRSAATAYGDSVGFTVLGHGKSIRGLFPSLCRGLEVPHCLKKVSCHFYGTLRCGALRLVFFRLLRPAHNLYVKFHARERCCCTRRKTWFERLAYIDILVCDSRGDNLPRARLAEKTRGKEVGCRLCKIPFFVVG